MSIFSLSLSFHLKMHSADISKIKLPPIAEPCIYRVIQCANTKFALVKLFFSLSFLNVDEPVLLIFYKGSFRLIQLILALHYENDHFDSKIQLKFDEQQVVKALFSLLLQKMKPLCLTSILLVFFYCKQLIEWLCRYSKKKWQPNWLCCMCHTQ